MLRLLARDFSLFYVVFTVFCFVLFLLLLVLVPVLPEFAVIYFRRERVKKVVIHLSFGIRNCSLV